MPSRSVGRDLPVGQGLRAYLAQPGHRRAEILFKHVLRSAAPTGLTVLSLQLIGMLGGVLIHRVHLRAAGLDAAVSSTSQGDLPVVMGVVMYTVTVVIIVNLAVDLLNGWLNPKVGAFDEFPRG